MRLLRDLLAGLPLPPAARGDRPAAAYAMPAAHLLGGDLPQGHMHVWSGPPGAGKTAFLLGLLLDAARRARGTCLATYDLPAASIALRVVAIESGVPLADLDRGALTADEAAAVARARARLEPLPWYVLEARGLPVASLADRCVRSTRRIDVLGVDFAEAVPRAPGSPLADTFRDLSALAKQRWMAVVAMARTSPIEGDEAPAARPPADRVGRLEAAPDAPTREASVVANRHGATPSCRLRLDTTSGRWLPADAAPSPTLLPGTGGAPGPGGAPAAGGAPGTARPEPA